MHNSYRANHNAQPLSWDDSLASDAAAWAARCVWRHSPFMWGENMAAGGASNSPAALAALWYTQEVCHYQYSAPAFSHTTGHFTQVWGGV